MCDFCLFYWGDLVLLQSGQRIVNNYLLNSCCRLTFISLHNLPYDYSLMCVCVWVLLLSSFYLFSCLRFTIFNQLQVFLFFLHLDLCVFIFLSLLFIFHPVNYLQSELVAALFFIASFPCHTNEKRESPSKIRKKVTKKSILSATNHNYKITSNESSLR